MPVLVYVPAPLRSKAGGQRQIELSADSVTTLLDEMEAAYPGITERLRREDGTLRYGLTIYVNGENVRFLQGLDTPLQDGDEVSIIPAVAGGRTTIRGGQHDGSRFGGQSGSRRGQQPGIGEGHCL